MASFQLAEQHSEREPTIGVKSSCKLALFLSSAIIHKFLSVSEKNKLGFTKILLHENNLLYGALRSITFVCLYACMYTYVLHAYNTIYMTVSR